MPKVRVGEFIELIFPPREEIIEKRAYKKLIEKSEREIS